MPTPTATDPFFDLWYSRSAGDLRSEANNSLGQALPFCKFDPTPQTPPTLVKEVDFDQRWKAVLDDNGSYVNDFGHRVAVKQRDGKGSKANDVDWAVYNLSRFFLLASAIRLVVDDRPPSILRRDLLDLMLQGSREEIRHLILPEMIRMKAQADTKTTINMPSNPYPYPVLPDDPLAIRVVVLLPSTEWHSDIICMLCNTNLDRSNVDKYEALSYVWGDPSKRRPITLSGQQFQATENLEVALRNLRYRDKHRVLWIDAMCINQNNVEERNAQVQQMDLIYSRAQKVIVWLGPESEESTSAIELIYECSLRRDNTHTADEFFEKYSKTHFRKDYSWGHGLSDVMASTSFGLEHLMKRPWFKRVWCVQELILGQQVVFQCGQRSIALEHFEPFTIYGSKWSQLNSRLEAKDFKRALTWSHDLSKTSESEATTWDILAKNLPNFAKLLAWKVRDRISVLGVLISFCERQASDPRDKVFGFYGIVSKDDPDRDAIKPDYTKTTFEVYTNVAVHFLQKYRSLDILSIATLSTKNHRDVSQHHFLPSWVPDWRDGERFGVSRRCKPIAFYGENDIAPNFDNTYNASFYRDATPIVFPDDDQVLALDGVVVDIVKTIGDVFQGIDEEGDQFPEVLSQWREIAGRPNQDCYKFSNQPMTEAWWRTLLGDVQMDHSKSKHGSRYRMPLKDVVFDGFLSFPPSPNEYTMVWGLFVSTTGLSFGRRFFRTAKGLLGLGPASAKEGDRVVVLFGGKALWTISPSIHQSAN
ncbi:heterokaryon incompatibility protein-domain-containing protein [Hypoxylon sp. NC1633]|nr:heterokaryon incompatibility protein-domain-containing protein [Hypoxylon sp. NC1633]